MKPETPPLAQRSRCSGRCLGNGRAASRDSTRVPTCLLGIHFDSLAPGLKEGKHTHGHTHMHKPTRELTSLSSPMSPQQPECSIFPDSFQ